MMTGYKKTAVRTMKLVIDGHVRELGEHEATCFAPIGSLTGSGEYRYYAGHSYFGGRKSIPTHRITAESDYWRTVLHEALRKLPITEVRGKQLWYGDWKLKILCSSQAFISYAHNLLALRDDEDEFVPFLNAFVEVSFQLTPPEEIEAFLASDRNVIEEY